MTDTSDDSAELPEAHEVEESENEGRLHLDAEELSGGHRLHWRASAYGLVTLVILFFGAAREPWARGLALLLMGGTMFLAPPRVKLPMVPACALLFLAAAPLTGLLPAGWLGILEPWRQSLMEDWGLPLGGLHSPEWRLTLECWLVTLIGVLWFWCCLAQNFSDGSRRLLLRMLALAAPLLVILSFLDKYGWEIPWWPRGLGHASDHQPPSFGPFANRNHTSSLFALLSVVSAAAAMDAFKNRSRLWLVFAVGVLLLLAGILVNSSRAGLLLFFVGMTLWLGTTAMRRGFMRKAVVSTALAGAVIAVLMASQAKLGQRVATVGISGVASDLRVWLAGQTLKAVDHAPWIGRGLGTFDHVFPQVCQEAFPDTRTIHPESDVLWALFEGGLLLVVPCLILAVWLFRCSGPWYSSHRKKRSHDSRSGRRIRRAFGIAAGLVLIHAVVDVPLHGLGYFALFSVVTAQAVRGRYLSERISRPVAWFFRAAALLVVLWGGLWIAFAAGMTNSGPASTASSLHDRAVAESAAGRRAEALKLVNEAIDRMPMLYRLYYLRAQIHLLMRHGSEVALSDFGRARALEPNYGPLCFEEGRYWLHFDPTLAVVAWKEGMRRYPREFENAMPRFQEILIAAAAYPEIQHDLWQVADRPSLQLVFLAHFPAGSLWDRCHEEFLARYPGLAGLNKAQIRHFLHQWQQKGDTQELIAYLQKHPGLKDLGWQVLAKDLAASGKFEEAYRLAAKHLPSPARSASLTASDVPSLERAVVLNPIDPLPAVELYYAQRAAGDLKAARKTLERAIQLPQSPAFLSREMASVLAESGDARAAWEILQSQLHLEAVEVSVLDDALSPEEVPSAPAAKSEHDALRRAWEGMEQ